MANTFTQRPIIIDTVMASGFLATISAVPGMGRPLRIKSIIWNAPGANASFVIQDNSTAANVLFQGTTPASFVGADPVYTFTLPILWKDWKVTTLGAGKLLIFPE